MPEQHQNVRGSLGQVAGWDALQGAADGARLLAVAVGLCRAVTVDEVLRVAVDEAVDAIGASAAVAYVATEDGLLTLSAARGLSAATCARLHVMPADTPLPLFDAFRGGAPIWIERREELLDRYPIVARSDTPEGALQSVAALPLGSGGRATGAVALSFAMPHAFHAEERRFLQTLIELATEAAERCRLHEEQALLYERAERAREQAELATRARDHLLAVVSHDLRTPLNAAMLRATSLANDAPEGSELQTHARGILLCTARMARLIGDLVDLANLEQGQLSIHSALFDPSDVMKECVELHAQAARERGVTIACDLDRALPALLGDRQRLVQVLCNLVGNAIKVSPAGDVVRLGAHVAEDQLVFSVSDRGPGIAPEHLTRIFELHFRAPDVPYEGTGLGLSIARGIVQAHGGRLWVESTLGAGSTFYVALPTA